MYGSMTEDTKPLLNSVGGENREGVNELEPEVAVTFGSIRVISSNSVSNAHQYSNSSHSPVKSFEGVHVYKRRWYILAVFAAFTFLQAYLWNDWGPIATSAEKVFHWSNSQIALFANWGCVTYLIAMPFFSWFIEKKGLRPACLFSAFLVALGGCLRCITFQQPYVTWLVNLCAVLNGFAGPVAMAGAPVLSAIWFPPNERTTATAVSTTLNYFGVAVPFIIGPALVKDLNPKNATSESIPASIIGNTSIPVTSVMPVTPLTHAPNPEPLPLANSSSAQYITEMENQIKFYTYVQGGVTAGVFLLMLLYFPSKPKLPPSISASMERVDFKSGLKSLFRKKHYFLIITAYSLAIGIFGPFMTVVDVNLSPVGISQDEAGWLGFFSTAAGCGFGFIVARLADVFSRRMKAFLLVLFTLSVGMFIWFILLRNGYIPFSKVQIYVSFIGGGAMIGGTIPLFYELSCETSYPVAEPIAAGVQTFVLNIVGFVFLILFYIPNIGVSWLNWVMIGSIVAGIPLLLIYKEQYIRLEIDSFSGIN